MIYNAFSLSKIQRIYFIYNKKLRVLVKLVMKYNYIYKPLYNVTIIRIDYRLLTRFLKFDLREEILLQSAFK